MKLQQIIRALEQWAPPALQESYDNAGLITGSLDWEITGAICTLDTTPEVVEEAVKNGCNLIVSHHPIVFQGLKKITGQNYVEKTIILAIQHQIAIYAIHTNLDNVSDGVNKKIAEKLGLSNLKILAPVSGKLAKLITFCPTTHKEQVLDALFQAGAGEIGKYSECSFSSEGNGTFKAGNDTHPFVGEQGIRHTEREERLEVIMPIYSQGRVIEALKNAHPYEEVAFDIYPMLNQWQDVGFGIIGTLPEGMAAPDFLQHVRKQFDLQAIKYTRPPNKLIQKVAVCGGAGSFLMKRAQQAGADAFVTSDVKYHEFFDAEGFMLADIGHWESEQFTIDLLSEFLQAKFPTFAVLKTGVVTNPVLYYLG